MSVHHNLPAPFLETAFSGQNKVYARLSHQYSRTLFIISGLCDRCLAHLASQHVSDEEVNVIIALSETETGKAKADDVVKNMMMARQERQDQYRKKRAGGGAQQV